MLTLHLTPIFAARNIANPFTFLVKAGFTRPIAHNIINNKISSFNFKHMELLCTVLHCTPNDILVFSATKNQNIPPHHPLRTLKPMDIKANWAQSLQSLPLDKISEIAKLLSEE